MRELTPAGEQPLADFMLPNYMALLAELARELGEADIARCDPAERANTVRRALAGKRALIVIDNLETLDETERMRVFQFLGRLPEGNKAIVTSRRRSDVDARAIRLDRLAQADALLLLDELAKRNRLLARATAAERQALYELTHGNPLLIQWTAGQLGRGQCRTVAAACDFLRGARRRATTRWNTSSATWWRASPRARRRRWPRWRTSPSPRKVEWVADLAGLAEPAALTALEDLADRALVVASPDGATFLLPPLAALFLRRRRPEAVAATAGRLTDRVYALALENGYQKYDRFPALEAEWPAVAAALPLFLAGPNDRLQTLCDALRQLPGLLRPLGRVAGPERAGGSQSGRGPGLVERGLARLMTLGARAAARAGRRGVALGRPGRGALGGRPRRRARARHRHPPARPRPPVGEGLRRGHRGVPGGAGAAARARRRRAGTWRSASTTSPGPSGLRATTRPRHATIGEALRIARKINYQDGMAYITGNLAELALDREQWPEAERLAREALALAEKLGRAELVGSDCHRIAMALLRQGSPRRRCPSPAARWRSWRSCATGIWTRRGGCWRSVRRGWVWSTKVAK